MSESFANDPSHGHGRREETREASREGGDDSDECFDSMEIECPSVLA